MPFGISRERTVSNVGAMAAEFFGPMFLVIVGLGVAVPSFPVVLGPGAGYGLTAFVLTYVLWIRSGAHFNTGVTLAKVATWMSGVAHRDYFGRGALLWDLVFGFFYIGLQLAGAIIGVLFLKYIDKSGLIAATTSTVPNGNLAGDENRALALGFMLNLVFVWVHLSVLGPRANAVVKQLGAPLVLGLTYGGVVIIAIYWGAGTVCNFAIDLALATMIGPNSPKKLWISAVAQILGAIGGYVMFWAQSYLDRMLELQILHGAKNMDHARVNSIAQVFQRYSHVVADMDTPVDGPLVAPHDTAPEQYAAAAAQHAASHQHQHQHHHRRHPSTMDY